MPTITISQQSHLTYSTFLTVVLVIMQHEAAATLTAVASKGVHTFMLAASIFFRALIYIC